MVKATRQHKERIINILTHSFASNKSVNYIAKPGRIPALMDYSFERCLLFGEVLLTEDQKACALILYPDREKTTLRTIFSDLKLIFQCIGIRNIPKVLSREKKMGQIKPDTAMTYLWFIGVDPEYQQTGIGSKLLQNIIEQSSRPIYLETSAAENLPWYERFGFSIYGELDLGYKIFFLRSAPH